MKRTRFCSLFFSLLFMCNHLLAQELPPTGTKSKQADKNFNLALKQYTLMDYTQALQLLDKALKEDPNYIDAMMLTADIYEKDYLYKKAISQYQKIIKISPEFPLAYCNLAANLFKTGDYEAAFQNANKYLTFNDIYGKKSFAEKIKNKAEYAKEAIKKPVPFKPENLGPAINTFENEYHPGITADEQTLIFTRLVHNENEDFYVSRKAGGKWQQAQDMGSPVNTPDNEGTVSLSTDGQYIFYTRCNHEGDMGSCDLILSKLDGNSWAEPKNLGLPVNARTWETQPSVSFDGKTVYFSSNRPGGYGESDIWYTTYNKGRWSPPINLGPEINTDGDEQSPFISKDDNTLYFNSTGHPGFGGSDLFYTRKSTDGRWQKPANLGYPINTQHDETCLIVAANGKDAYIVSERDGGYGGLDIWKFELYETARAQKTSFVKGMVFDARTNKKLSAKIELTDLTTGKIIVESYTNKLSGEFLVCLQGNRNYALNVSAEGYLFHSENFSLKNQTAVEPLTLSVPLYTIAAGSKVVLKNIFFDTDKFVVKDESKVELDKLIQFLTINTKVRVEIGGHTDNTGDRQKNLILSTNRAKAVQDYLVENKIAATRLVYKGYGDTQPLADNKTEGGKAKNRRTEFKILP